MFSFFTSSGLRSPCRLGTNPPAAMKAPTSHSPSPRPRPGHSSLLPMSTATAAFGRQCRRSRRLGASSNSGCFLKTRGAESFAAAASWSLRAFSAVDRGLSAAASAGHRLRQRSVAGFARSRPRPRQPPPSSISAFGRRHQPPMATDRDLRPLCGLRPPSIMPFGRRRSWPSAAVERSLRSPSIAASDRRRSGPSAAAVTLARRALLRSACIGIRPVASGGKCCRYCGLWRQCPKRLLIFTRTTRTTRAK